MMSVAKESKGGLCMPAPKCNWFGISFDPPRSFKNNGEVHLLVGVLDPDPDAAKAFVGCPKGHPAVILGPYDTPEDAIEMVPWNIKPLDRMVQLPDIEV